MRVGSEGGKCRDDESSEGENLPSALVRQVRVRRRQAIMHQVYPEGFTRDEMWDEMR